MRCKSWRARNVVYVFMMKGGDGGIERSKPVYLSKGVYTSAVTAMLGIEGDYLSSKL